MSSHSSAAGIAPAPSGSSSTHLSAVGAISAPTAPNTSLFAHLSRDLPAGLVVFLVALPLCLGIAQASGAPLLSGLIAGMVGGLIIASLSRSPLSVAGPAAGLAVIVFSTIQQLGFTGFLLAVVLAGAMQVLLGVFRLGVIAHFFPTAVIKGMLAAIGVLIVFKQLPHAVGYDKDWEGDEGFLQADGNTLSSLGQMFGAVTPGAIIISGLCVLAYFAWPKLQRGALKLVPAALVAVVISGLVATALPLISPAVALEQAHLVALPRFDGLSSVLGAIVLPQFDRLGDVQVWSAALTLGIVASIETLLSLEAVDRLDPHRRISPPNRELVAQGIGNMVSGFLGGLPVTSVIVRSSANVQAGAQTRLSSMVHGVLLLLGVLFMAPLLNHVPLAALAVVLIVVGLKLTPLSLWRTMWRAGWAQFVPFAVTVVAVVFTDLLKGTIIGLAVGVLFAMRLQQRNAVLLTVDGKTALMRFTKDLTFMQKAKVRETLRSIPDGTHVIVDRSVCDFIDDDIEEMLAEFAVGAKERGVTVEDSVPEQVKTRRALMAQSAH